MIGQNLEIFPLSGIKIETWHSGRDRSERRSQLGTNDMQQDEERPATAEDEKMLD